MADSALTQVNEHYLDKVMDLSQAKEVEASEDIYAANGMKLVAKGARLSPEMQERLILHRLKKPLETSIAVNDGIDMQAIRAEAERLVEEVKALRPLAAAAGDDGPLGVLARMDCNQSLLMLLSVINHGGPGALQHCIVASLVAAGLGRKLRLNEDRLLSLATAGLFHDVGKLYIKPEYLRPSRKLKPSEWRHVISHPIVGQKLLAEVGGLNKTAAQAVLEHHERYNGNGYPQQLAGSAISVEGQVLAAAEILASMFVRDELTLQRAGLALRIVPGEHALPIVSILSRAASETPGQEVEGGAPQAAELARARKALLGRLQSLVNLSADLCAAPALKSAATVALTRQALTRLHLIQQALASTGVDFCGNGGESLLPESITPRDRFEIHGVILEISWRLSELERDLVLHSEHLAPQEMQALEPLIALLEQDGLALAG